MKRIDSSFLYMFVVVAFAVVSLVVLPSIGQIRMYPFSNWSLFSDYPRLKRIYDIRIYSLNEGPTQLICRSEQCNNFGFQFKKREIMFLQYWGHFLQNNDSGSAQKYFNLFQQQLFLNTKRAIEIEVIVRLISPIHYVLEGEVMSESTLTRVRLNES